MNIIDIKNCNVYLEQKKILHDFSMQIKDFQHTAIIGPNGCGKSTLIRLLIGELHPSRFEGENPEIKLLGSDSWNIFDLRKTISLVSQKFAEHLLDTAPISVFDAVASSFFGSYGFFADDKINDQQLAITNEILSSLNLTELKHRSINELSLGQLRKVLIARAMVLKPKMILLDEPSLGLDINAQSDFLSYLNAVTNDTTILLVTHHLEEIIPAIKKILLIKDGRIFKFGDKTEILTEKNLSELFDSKIKLNLSHKGFYSMHKA